MAGLFLSGVTAFPLQTELRWVLSILETPPVRRIADATHLLPWIDRVHALSTTNAQYLFLAYGTDWLAFAHFVLAILFIGPYRDPVRNRWIIVFGFDCLRRSDSACSYRGSYPGHSGPMATPRLQLWRLRSDSSDALQATYRRTRAKGN